MNPRLPLTIFAHLLLGLFFVTRFSWAETNLEFFLGDSEKYQDVLVEAVLSTDTIKLESGEKIRLIGLKALEPPKKERNQERDEFGFVKRGPVMPETLLEDRALQFVQNLLEGERVRLEFDIQKKDSGHRTLAYVFLIKDNRLTNAEILRQGFAYLHISPPNAKYNDALREAYQEARQEQRGAAGE
ncbi:MAG TPA: hypothetical protein DD723_08205 [Candidatus Omnitrophica bacterium]|nr:MAG: hypothetical protein A2Z81_08160 [Omnitrophica WOR_2 bacterium GWA2_45_18]HBR15506.1 hypothetical protein [Candidatus Omnitrophota bacterium]